MSDWEDYLRQFRAVSEDHLRDLLSRNVLNTFKTRAARQVLAEKERERSDASQAENALLARSAADAARDQAEAAREANTIAKQANMIATLALIAAVIAIAIAIVGIFV
jgi:CHASE3 domain sensor protein